MHISATWIIVQEYFDSAGFYKVWHGFIQMYGMLKLHIMSGNASFSYMDNSTGIL